LLGIGYNLGNEFNRGCYLSQQSRTSSGNDTLRIIWNRTTGDTASFKLAEILGLGYEARRAVRGTIVLTGVTYLYADDVSPSRQGCGARTKDGLPLNPAVVALAGVQSYAFSLFDAQGKTLNAGVDKIGLKANRVDERADTTTVGFGTLRWVGVRMNGYELDGPVGHMTTTGPFSLEEPYNLGNNLQIRVFLLQDGRYVVEHGFAGLGTALGADTVKKWETFLLGSPGTVPSRGFFHPAAIVPHSKTMYRLNRGDPRKIVVREFQRHADVDSLNAWLGRR
jgi:hypothetical protein